MLDRPDFALTADIDLLSDLFADTDFSDRSFSCSPYVLLFACHVFLLVGTPAAVV